MEKIKVLLVEGIHAIAKARLEEEGYEVDLISHAPDEKELIEKLKSYSVLGIRSKTEVTKKVLDESRHLIGIGAFCIGTNQIQLSHAKSIGVPVFNAPHANTRSVAELVIAEMISLSRQLGDRNIKAHQGDWI